MDEWRPTLDKAAAAGSTKGAVSNIPFFPDKEKITICTSEWSPGVKCLGLRDPLKWSGYEIQVFKALMPVMGWTYDMIEWRCLEWTEMEQLLLKTNQCDIAPAGMWPERWYINNGMRFSVATVGASKGILVRNEESSPGIWYFFSAMDLSVWLALLGTALCIGLILWLFEVGTRSLVKETMYPTDMVWMSLSRPVGLGEGRVISNISNLALLMWGFLGFIVMALYCANLTANLTISQILSRISNVNDLQGRSVATWKDYQEELVNSYRLETIGFPWDNTEDEAVMVDGLVRGDYDALVLDYSTLAVIDADNCKTKLLPSQFDLIDQSVGFPKSSWQREGLLDTFNLALRELKEFGTIEDLQNEYIYLPLAECKSGDTSTGYSSVSWEQVAGLWIILGATVGFGCLWIISYRLWLVCKEKVWFRKMFSCFYSNTKDRKGIVGHILQQMKSQTSGRLASEIACHRCNSARMDHRMQEFDTSQSPKDLQGQLSSIAVQLDHILDNLSHGHGE